MAEKLNHAQLMAMNREQLLEVLNELLPPGRTMYCGGMLYTCDPQPNCETVCVDLSDGDISDLSEQDEDVLRLHYEEICDGSDDTPSPIQDIISHLQENADADGNYWLDEDRCTCSVKHTSNGYIVVTQQYSHDLSHEELALELDELNRPIAAWDEREELLCVTYAIERLRRRMGLQED